MKVPSKTVIADIFHEALRRDEAQTKDWNEYLQKGYPIATGVLEGACRYLVKDRMEITGARWSLEGAEAVLKVRAMKMSGDFEEYWEFYERTQYEKNYELLYQNPQIVRPQSFSQTPSP